MFARANHANHCEGYANLGLTLKLFPHFELARPSSSRKSLRNTVYICIPKSQITRWPEPQLDTLLQVVRKTCFDPLARSACVAKCAGHFRPFRQGRRCGIQRVCPCVVLLLNTMNTMTSLAEFTRLALH